MRLLFNLDEITTAMRLQNVVEQIQMLHKCAGSLFPFAANSPQRHLPTAG